MNLEPNSMIKLRKNLAPSAWILAPAFPRYGHFKMPIVKFCCVEAWVSGLKSFYYHSALHCTAVGRFLQIEVLILSCKSSFSFVISEWIKGDWRVNNIRMFFFGNRAMQMWECTNIKDKLQKEEKYWKPIFQERPKVPQTNSPVCLYVEANISSKYFRQANISRTEIPQTNIPVCDALWCFPIGPIAAHRQSRGLTRQKLDFQTE